jgi:hypothetical protein
MPVTRQRTGVLFGGHQEREEFFADQIVQGVFLPEALTDVFRRGALVDPDFMELDGRAAHGRFLSPRIRRTEVRPILRRRAISALLTPARYGFAIWLVFLPAVRGRPRCVPFSRFGNARANPLAQKLMFELGEH